MRGSRAKLEARERTLRRALYVDVTANAAAAVAMSAAAAFVPTWMTLFNPMALAWIPVAAFAAAALARLAPQPSWRSLLAMTLNLAALLVCLVFSLLAAIDGHATRLGLPFAVPATLLAGWNLRQLSRTRSPPKG